MSTDPIVIREKAEDHTVVKLAKIMALVAASPFIFVGGIVALVMLTGIVIVAITSGTFIAQDVLPWLLGAAIVFSLLPAVRTRISNKHQILALKNKVHVLELELSESRLELLKIHESAEFHRQLEQSSKKIKS